jgi:dTDP-4-dehydrorhamnose reductase
LRLFRSQSELFNVTIATVTKGRMNYFLILGADSRLARHFISKYPGISIPVTRAECDITIPLDIEKIFRKYSTKYILNCAAITDVEYCETHPDEAFSVNTVGPENLSRTAEKFGRRLILLSSNYAQNPTNVYGKTKSKMEEITGKHVLTIRTDFYDTENFIVKNLLLGNKINVYSNAFFNPVSITRLTEEIYKNRNKNGLMNIFASRCITYLEFAELFSKYKKISKKLINADTMGMGIRPLNGCVKSDIRIKIETDLKKYADNI